MAARVPNVACLLHPRLWCGSCSAKRCREIDGERTEGMNEAGREREDQVWLWVEHCFFLPTRRDEPPRPPEASLPCQFYDCLSTHGFRSLLSEKPESPLWHVQVQLRAPLLAGPVGQLSRFLTSVWFAGTRTSQPSFIIHSITSQWPPSAAQCRAVQPPRSLVSQEAPCLRRYFTTSRCPA